MPPESCGKEALKLMRNELHLYEVKLLPRGEVIHSPYKIHMHVFHFDITSDCIHQLKKVKCFQVTPESLNKKGDDKANERPSM